MFNQPANLQTKYQSLAKISFNNPGKPRPRPGVEFSTICQTDEVSDYKRWKTKFKKKRVESFQLKTCNVSCFECLLHKTCSISITVSGRYIKLSIGAKGKCLFCGVQKSIPSVLMPGIVYNYLKSLSYNHPKPSYFSKKRTKKCNC